MRYFLPNIRNDVISEEHYYNSNENIDTFSTRCMIITNKNSNINSIYQFTKNMYNNLGFFKNNLKIFTSIFKWDLIYKIPMLEYHKGSIKLYKERGYISNKKCPNKMNFFCFKFKFPKNKMINKIKPNKNNPSFFTHKAALKDNNKKIKWLVGLFIFLVTNS